MIDRGAVVRLILSTLLISIVSVRQNHLARENHGRDNQDIEAITSWLSDKAMLLKTTEPGSSPEDLRPLTKILQSSRVIGLGEPTHGSREFFRLKHRLVEFMVKEAGVTVLALEASLPATARINEYVLQGKGDRDKALADQGLWAWDTRELIELIEWMRKYNQGVSESRKIRFLGFDMHNSELGIGVVSAYLRKVAPERLEALQDVFKMVRPTGLGRQHFEYSILSSQQKHRVLARLNELIGFLALNQTRFTLNTPAVEFQNVMDNLRVLAQFADVYSRPDIDNNNPAESKGFTRDFYMAENIKRIVDAQKPNARIVVWAHNDHIGSYKNSTGYYLRKFFGDGYYSLGLSFNQGAFQAREIGKGSTIGSLTEFTVGPAPEGSVEWYLARPGRGPYLIDFRYSKKDKPIAEWLATPRSMRTIGLGFSPTGQQPLHKVTLEETFDGIAFIEKTTRAQPNPTGFREAWEFTSR